MHRLETTMSSIEKTSPPLHGSRFPDILIPGWFSSHKLYERVVNSATNDSVLVELGSYFGESAVYMGKLLQERELDAAFYTVDVMEWDDWMNEEAWYNTRQEIRDHAWLVANQGKNLEAIIRFHLDKYGVEDRVRLIRGDSIETADRFAADSVRFVYLDTTHTYTRVRDEISAWHPKIEPGGIIAGDDFGRDDDNDGGVRRAVREAFNEYTTDGTTWYAVKSDG